MRVRIHRGAAEVGGSCVELDAGGKRLLLDLGRPLWARRGDDVPLPDVGGLAGGDPDLLGVVLSHAHADHYGLVAQAGADVPVYAGRATADILREAAFFSPAGADLRPAGELRDREPLRVGPFTVTPLLTDHSAFDAYSLLVEAGGRRLLYTGDVRAHGRKRALFERLVEHPPAVDAALLEGTRVGRDSGARRERSEDDVEAELATLAARTRGALVVMSPAQNVDRVVSVYRACRRSGRTLVVDLYTATVARATGRPTIPQVGFPRLRVWLPQRQRVLVKDSREFDRVATLGRARIFAEAIAADPGRFCVLAQPSSLSELVRAGCLRDAAAVWSMWDGYLGEPGGVRAQRLLEGVGVPLHRVHASGHATVEDLQRLARALAPARIVPIHTAAPELYAERFARVEPHADGEWWEV